MLQARAPVRGWPRGPGDGFWAAAAGALTRSTVHTSGHDSTKVPPDPFRVWFADSTKAVRSYSEDLVPTGCVSC